MKIYLSTLTLFCFTLFTSFAFAGTTTLTTYYPAPTGAYNQVKLSTNFTAYQSTAAAYCNSSNVAALYFDTSLGQMAICSPTQTAGSANGAVYTDTTGNLNVIMNNNTTPTTFPQQCYNAFCSYPAYCTTTPCPSNCSGNLCRPKYTQQIPIDSQSDPADIFMVSDDTIVVSSVCCLGYNGSVAPPASTQITDFTMKLVDPTGTPLYKNYTNVTWSTIASPTLPAVSVQGPFGSGGSPPPSVAVDPLSASPFSTVPAQFTVHNLKAGTYYVAINLINNNTINFYFSVSSSGTVSSPTGGY